MILAFTKIIPAISHNVYFLFFLTSRTRGLSDRKAWVLEMGRPGQPECTGTSSGALQGVSHPTPNPAQVSRALLTSGHIGENCLRVGKGPPNRSKRKNARPSGGWCADHPEWTNPMTNRVCSWQGGEASLATAEGARGKKGRG